MRCSKLATSTSPTLTARARQSLWLKRLRMRGPRKRGASAVAAGFAPWGARRHSHGPLGSPHQGSSGASSKRARVRMLPLLSLRMRAAERPGRVARGDRVGYSKGVEEQQNPQQLSRARSRGSRERSRRGPGELGDQAGTRARRGACGGVSSVLDQNAWVNVFRWYGRKKKPFKISRRNRATPRRACGVDDQRETSPGAPHTRGAGFFFLVQPELARNVAIL